MTPIPPAPHPGRTDVIDVFDLTDGRVMMTTNEFPERADLPLWLFIEQYPDRDSFAELRADGCVWLRVEDLPVVVRSLTGLLRRYEARARDAVGRGDRRSGERRRRLLVSVAPDPDGPVG